MSIIKPIINIDNQPVNTLLDNIIITQIVKYLDTRQKTLLITLLGKLKDIGLNQQRIHQILVQSFAIYQLSKSYRENVKNDYIQTLKYDNLIGTNFEDDLKNEQLSANLIYYIEEGYLKEATESVDAHETNVNGIDINGDTPLILAIDRSRLETYQNLTDLLIKKADLNQPGKEGKTPLMHAIEQKSTGTILLLLDKGANPNLKDVFGKTALDYATETGDQEIISALKAIGKPATKITMPLNEQLCALSSLNSTLVNLANKI